MTRTEFIRNGVRTALIALLGLIGIALGGRVVSGNECSSCRIKDKCSGGDDCILLSSGEVK